MSNIPPKQCVVCGIIYQPRSRNSTMAAICSVECRVVRRVARQKIVFLPCLQCGKTVECKGSLALNLARKGRAYCSEECKTAYLKRLSSQTASDTNRRYASERMKQHNPMSNPSTRAKMQRKLQERGWGSGQRGGNGEITIPQARLALALGREWETEVPIPTGKPRGSGYPPSYKVDIGNPALKIAVEVDGKTHKLLTRKDEDRKKTTLLEALGWTVLRFWNEEVMGDLNACVQTVMSITSKSNTITPTLQMEW